MTKAQYELLQRLRPELGLPRTEWFCNPDWHELAKKPLEQLIAEATAAKLAGEELFEMDVPF